MSLIGIAAFNGDYETFVSEHNKKGLDKTEAAHMMNRVIEYGHLEIVRFLHVGRRKDKSFDLILAARFGRLDIVQYFIENRYDPTWMDWDVEDALFEAIEYEQWEVAYDLFHRLPLHSIPEMSRFRYNKLIPFIQEHFAETFDRIRRENIVREFLAKKLVYHPTSSYVKRVVESF